MIYEEIQPGTAVKISFNVNDFATGDLVNATAIDVVICDASGSNPTAYDITDLTNPSMGVYSVVHFFPLNSTRGLANIRITADEDDPTIAITELTKVRILEIPAAVLPAS